MTDTADTFEWYDYRALRSRNARISVVAGPPSIGKTYGAKFLFTKDAIENETEFMWVRRNKTELTPAKDGFFDALMEHYPGYEFSTLGNSGRVRKDGKTWQTVVRFVSLTTAHQIKGTEFPKVNAIVYDECFTEPGMPYLEDEVYKLTRLWITVNRSRVDRHGKAKTKVYLLGNARRLDNPFFLAWGFDDSREWQKGKFTGGDVVLHLVDAAKYERRVTESIYGAAMGADQFSYADGDYFVNDGGYVIAKRPEDSKPVATLVTMRGTYGLWESPDWSKMFVTIGPLQADRPTVTFEPMAVLPGIVLAEHTHPIRRFARRNYRRGTAYFVTPGAMLAQQALAR